MTDPTPRPERVTLTDEEPTEDGWYAYDGGRQTTIFRLTRGQWYVTTDSGQCDPCEWGYIEQALGVWNLVSLDLAVREQALRDQIVAAERVTLSDDLAALIKAHDFSRMTCYDHDGHCCPEGGCHDVNEHQYVHLARILAAREQALREEIAGECRHAYVETFRTYPPHAKCLDCGQRVEQRWVAARGKTR